MSPVRSFLRAFFLLVLIVALPATAGNYRWTLHGPAGGSVDRIEFDPLDPSIVYATGFNGFFRSADGGQSWTFVRGFLGRGASDVAIASGDPRKVFTATPDGLYASVDRGQTWFKRHDSSSSDLATNADGSIVYGKTFEGVVRSSNGGATFGGAGMGLPFGVVTALVLDPQNADVVWVSFLSSAGVYKSVDRGAHWSPANSGLTTSAVYSLIVDPTNPSTLYAGTNGSIFKSTNGGTSWSALPVGLSTVFRSLAISRSNPSTLVAGTDRGVLKTTNGGATWTTPKLPGTTAVAINPLDPNVILAVAGRSLFRSIDGGATWTLTGRGLTAQSVRDIAVDRLNPSIVYAAGFGGVFKSTDRGLTWTAPASSETHPAGPSTAVLVVDPFNSSTLYAISTIYVQRSLNGGATWSPFGNGLPVGAASELIADPLVAGTLYAVSGNSFYKKRGDAAWTLVGSFPASSPSFATIDPRNPATVYVGANNIIYKSVNGGATWSAVVTFPTNFTPLGLAADPFVSDHLFTWYLFTAYESMDGGVTWTEVRSVEGPVAFDPAVPGRVYAADSNGVRRSNDGGRTWGALRNADGDVDTGILVVAPDGESIYTGGIYAGVWTYHFGRRRAVHH